MPDLSTSLHLNMLKHHSLPRRLRRAVWREFTAPDIYGFEWGDPDKVDPLKHVRDRWVLPYVQPTHVCVEIGPGGGRWTRYLLGFSELYAIDYHEELLRELKKTLNKPNMIFVKNNGTDFPSVPDKAVDFLFSYGVFVHLDAPIIREYLHNMRRVLRPTANAVIHYSDKTKIMGRETKSFSDNDPCRMREMVTESGFSIIEEDLTSLWHSALIRFTPEANQ